MGESYLYREYCIYVEPFFAVVLFGSWPLRPPPPRNEDDTAILAISHASLFVLLLFLWQVKSFLY